MTKARTQLANIDGAPNVDPRFSPVVQFFARDLDVTYGGKGFGSGALKVNDKIFAMITSKRAFVVKLSRTRVAELVAAKKGELFDPGSGRLMKEWFVVRSAPTTWLGYAQEALTFIREESRKTTRR